VQMTRLLDRLGYHGRDRLLTPAITTYLTLQRALENSSISGLRHLSGLEFSPSAYCQAIQRLPVEYFTQLTRTVIGGLYAADSAANDRLWEGHRLFFIDGTGVSMPDTAELQNAFGQPGGQPPGCGFPVAHLLVQFAAHG